MSQTNGGKYPGIVFLIGFFFSFLCTTPLLGQTNHYAQFWNEFAFTRSLKGKWASELNLGQTWTSTADNKNMFYRNSQLYVRLWVHYYASSRWKISSFLSYYYNRSVPEINQEELPELRFAVQGTYYIHKVGYTLLTRFRIEDRKLKNNAGVWEAFYRFRAQLKMVLPLNGKVIRKGVFYGIASDELFFKTGARLTGNQAFDRNRLTLGAGYSFTDDVQVEVTYANEYLPREGTNEMYNALQVNFAFNNLLPNLKKSLFKKKE
jgi:Protein of unknown function (DUF2490)